MQVKPSFLINSKKTWLLVRERSDGIYTEVVEQTKENSTNLEQKEEESVPGFGILICLTSVLIAIIRYD